MGLMAPAERWPYEPLAALLVRDPFIMVAKEFGEKRIMEFISNESEYGDEESARLRLTLARRLPPPALDRGPFRRPLASRLK